MPGPTNKLVKYINNNIYKKPKQVSKHLHPAKMAESRHKTATRETSQAISSLDS